MRAAAARFQHFALVNKAQTFASRHFAAIVASGEEWRDALAAQVHALLADPAHHAVSRGRRPNHAGVAAQQVVPFVDQPAVRRVAPVPLQLWSVENDFGVRQADRHGEHGAL